jgi:hypothetical protein
MGILRSVETRFMQVFTFIMIAIVGTAPVAVLLMQPDAPAGPVRFGFVAVWFAAAVAAGFVSGAAIIEGAYRSETPYGVAVADMLPRVPRVLKPFLTLWWLTHFVVCVFAAVMFHSLHVDSREGLSIEAMGVVVTSISGAAMAYAGTLFLILGLGVWSGTGSLIARIWRFRVPIDVGIGLLLPVVTLVGGK